jgi:hypothetical protein
MTEIPGASIISGNWYVGLWIITPATFGAKTVSAGVSGGGNAGRQIWLGASSYVNVGNTAGGAAQLTTPAAGQTISSSPSSSEMIVNVIGSGAGTPFGSYTQTAKLGPSNVPGQFTCGVFGQAVGGVSRTFTVDENGISVVIRLTP